MNDNINTSAVIPQNHARAFLARVLTQTEILGRKQAEERSTRTTGESIMIALSTGFNTPVDADLMGRVDSLIEMFRNIRTRNEFETNVVRNTLDAIELGRVDIRQANFVAWAGKVAADRQQAAAAIAQASVDLPVGKAQLKVVFEGIRIVQTAFGDKVVHAFVMDDGKKLEWWTDARHEEGMGGTILLDCRVKAPSAFRGQVTYKVTHCKWIPVA